MIDRIDGLRHLMESQRTRWQRWNLLGALGWTLSAVWGYFLLAVLVDNLVHLPIWGRLATASGLAVVLFWFGRSLAQRWHERHATVDEIALAIERRFAGQIQNRLINTLQLSRESAQGQYALAPALVQENCRQLSQLRLPAAVAVQPAAMWLALAGTFTAIAAIGWMWQPQRFASSAKRILLPFASVDPVYRTRLEVEPGNIEASGDVEIRVRILGERPAEISILLDEQNRRSTQLVSVHSETVTYTLRNIQRSLSYAVHGGDFTSPYYRIEVPTPARLQSVEVNYHFPEYTRLPDKSVQTSGDLEALEGTQAQLNFVFDQPVEAVRLRLREGSASSTDDANHHVTRSVSEGVSLPVAADHHAETSSLAHASGDIELKKLSATEFSGELTFANVTEYALETERANRPPHLSAWFNIRTVADELPRPTLTGLPTNGELPIDSAMALQVDALDDIGLSRTGLFFRKVKINVNAEPMEDDGWIALQTWPAGNARQTTNPVEITPITFGVSEGDRIELAARASDARPDRAETWTTGTTHLLLMTGDGSQLQLLYEQILKSEAEIAGAIAVEQKLHAALDVLIRKLDADPAADGNVPERVKALVMEAAEHSKTQDQLRQTAGRIAREMAPPAGSLRLSVAMLADSEMIRAIRVLDSVATRDDAAGRRTSFADARATMARTLQSLGEIHKQYMHFRKEWELAHMTPFLRMLADRQAILRDQSVRFADRTGEPVDVSPRTDSDSTVRGLTPSGSPNTHVTAARRQQKLIELCGLAATAFSGLAERAAESESPLSEAFAQTADALVGDVLLAMQKSAQSAIEAQNWSLAAQQQTQAAAALEDIYTKLREAMTEAARKLLAEKDQLDKSQLDRQAELGKLKEGYSDDRLDEPDGLKLEEIIHQAEVAQQKKKKGEGDDESKPNDYLFPDSAVPGLQRADTGMRQEFKNLSLAKTPGGEPSFPNQSDRKGNKVKPHIQEKFEDLVGDLLEEEDAMKENYETYNLNAAFNINEKGDVGKQGGDLNSTAAASATGNQKPPTTNVGGASRIGRQGARAHGVAVGNESINRRGRDKVQEGQDRVPDQKDTVKETKSNDPQSDTSTGIGGRKVESDDAKFSLSDVGEWTDDMINRMDKPQAKNSIVERQGGKLDASVAEMMRDMNGKQEQIIERLKTIRKDLKNLYLPTEHLDQLIDQMQANLHSLNDRPSAEIFRLQQQTFERVRGVLQVFHQAHSGFQASLPREQRVRGNVLDDPARSVPPGYEEAVKTYYQRLAAPDRMP